MDDAVDVRASAHQLGVDRVLGVRRCSPSSSSPSQETRITWSGVISSKPNDDGFIQTPRPLRIACRYVTPDEVALILELEDPAAEGDLRAQFVAHRAEIMQLARLGRGHGRGPASIVLPATGPSGRLAITTAAQRR